jgi:hypothetical protein
MANEFEVLNPWAETDPIPTKGIPPRVGDLNGKNIGLFLNSKIAASPMLTMVEEKLKERYPAITFSRFIRIPNVSVAETPDQMKYEEWINGIDAIIYAHGD